MTDFFSYENLTWPEVAELPRDTPLVLPLGSGYPSTSLTVRAASNGGTPVRDGRTGSNLLAAQLGNPPRAGLLPPIPFGWRGSGLTVPETTFFPVIANLLDSLREDGFSRVYCLTPQGLDPQFFARLIPPTSHLQLPHPTQKQAAQSLPPDSERGKVILIPIGHTEEHGHHLPLSVDTLIIDAIARGTVGKVVTRSCSLPVMPYGVSTHRQAFAATLNVGGRAFEDFWLAVIDMLVARGFDRFYFISGHGGNVSFLINVVKYAGERHRRIFCATTWLHTSGHIGGPAIEKYRESPIGGMGHAGELETSFMLHLRPDLCHMEHVIDETDFVSTPNYYMDWIEGGSLVANPPWDDDSKTGAYGAGSLGTAEKGRLWLEAAIQEKVAHVEEIHEQHERREERRKAGYGLWGKSSDQ